MVFKAPKLYKLHFSIIAILCGFSTIASSQINNPTIGTGSVIYVMPKQLEEDLRVNNTISLSDVTIQGYRIQVFFGAERLEANKLNTQLQYQYPNETVYLAYQQPNYRVKIGNFRTVIEAMQLYRELSRKYPSVQLVQDRIELPKLD
ncbi:MAG: hypothetical protein SGJ04_01225 [Bacteroidota bacterium]|nr:hypothetical protein [Bacteroidota bacterium]